MKHRVCALTDLPENGMKSFEIGGEPLLLARIKDELFAIHDMCSHAMAYLSEGELLTDVCQVRCPDHAAVFDLKTGAALEAPAVAPVEAYEVTIDGDDVFVEMD